MNAITGDRPGKARLVKLVRDRVAERMPADWTVEIAAIPDRETAVKSLRAKLVEEALEYLLNPEAGELADVLEVVRTLAHYDVGIGMEGVEWYATKKREDRGGFNDLMGLYVVGPGETL